MPGCPAETVGSVGIGVTGTWAPRLFLQTFRPSVYGHVSTLHALGSPTLGWAC